MRSDPRSITIAATEEKLGWVREAAGERFESLEINVYPTGTPPMVTDSARKTAADVLDGIRARTGTDVTVDEFLESPHVFIGSVDGLVAKFTELRERLGISSFMIGDVRRWPRSWSASPGVDPGATNSSWATLAEGCATRVR